MIPIDPIVITACTCGLKTAHPKSASFSLCACGKVLVDKVTEKNK